MPRVKRGTKRRAKRKKILDRASGYFLTKSNLHRAAKEAVDRALKFAYSGRKQKKRQYRSLWIVRIGAAAREAGRDAGSIGMEARVTWAPADTDRFSTQVEEWRQVGATHLSIDTMSIGLTTVDDHIAALEHAAGVIALVPKSNGQ